MGCNSANAQEYAQWPEYFPFIYFITDLELSRSDEKINETYPTGISSTHWPMDFFLARTAPRIYDIADTN